MGFSDPGRERPRLIERRLGGGHAPSQLVRGLAEPRHHRLGFVESPGHPLEQPVGGAADCDLRATEEVALREWDLSSRQLDRFPVEQGPELAGSPGASELLGPLEELFQLTLPSP